MDPLTKSYPMLTPYQFASNRPIDGIDLDGLERVHYMLEFMDNSKPVLRYLGKEEARQVSIPTVLLVMGKPLETMTGWDGTITIGVPYEAEVIVHAPMDNGTDIGYRFANMKEAFIGAESGFADIDRFDPSKTTNAEEMRYNDMQGTSEALGQIGQAVANFSARNAVGNLERNAVQRIDSFADDAIKLTTSSKSFAPSRTYTIYSGNGQLYKFGVTDANLTRYGQSLLQAGPGAYGKYSSIIPKSQAHIMEKYLRSLQYNSTGQYALPGMKIPYPVNFNTGLPIRPKIK